MLYIVRASFTDRRQGPGTGRTLEIEATSMPVALGKGAREFWKGLDRKQRNDCRTSGLNLTVREKKGPA